MSKGKQFFKEKYEAFQLIYSLPVSLLKQSTLPWLILRDDRGKYLGTKERLRLIYWPV